MKGKCTVIITMIISSMIMVLCIIFSGTKSSLKAEKATVVNSKHMDCDCYISPVYPIEYNGCVYEVDLYGKFTEKYELPCAVKKSQVGNLLEKNIFFRNPKEGKEYKNANLYSFAGIKDNSIIIVRSDDGEYYYAYKCEE